MATRLPGDFADVPVGSLCSSSRRPAGTRTTTSNGTKQAGFDRHLVKPLDPDALNQLLSQTLESR
jgi:CheY-like chemotaxis protein